MINQIEIIQIYNVDKKRVKNVNIEKRMVTVMLKQSINWALLSESASRFKLTTIARGRI